LHFQPSEQNTYADIEAVYRCLIETYGAREEDIILYGQSVGSGPTCDLASRLPRLRAVVLHSPIMSGLRVMYPVKHTYWFDIYKVFLMSFCRTLAAKAKFSPICANDSLYFILSASSF
jgi:acetyl esterase/lipase